MSIRVPTLITAGILGALLAAGSFTAHAGDGCTKDKSGKKDTGTTSLWSPAAGETVLTAVARS